MTRPLIDKEETEGSKQFIVLKYFMEITRKWGFGSELYQDSESKEGAERAVSYCAFPTCACVLTGLMLH